MTRPFEFLDDCARRYGDLFTLRLSGWGTLAILSEPAAIQEVFAAPHQVLAGGKANEFMRPLLGGHSVFLGDGPSHMHRRRLAGPSLHGRGQNLPRAVILAAETALRAWPTHEPLSLHAAVRRLSLELLLHRLIGVTDRGLVERFADCLFTLTGDFSGLVAYMRPLQRDLGRWSPGGWLRRHVSRLDGLVYDTIAARRCSPDGGDDMLAALLSARDEDGAPLGDRDIRDQVVSALVAGHDTPASAVAWAVYWLLRSPEAGRRLAEEVNALGDVASGEAVSQASYLDAVCQETLRISPVVEAVQRLSLSPVRLLGYDVPAGVLVSPCAYLLHRRPALFPEPDVFRPQRFLERRYAPSEFIPFGGGAHRCLGAGLAMQLMKTILALLFRSFEVEAVDRGPVRGIRRNVTVTPSTGTVVRLRPR